MDDKYLNDQGLSDAWEIIKKYIAKEIKANPNSGGGSGINLPLSVVDGKLCITYTQEEK